MNKLRIAFFGTPEESIIIAQALFDAGYPLVCVVTKPPRPVGRKQIMTPTPLAIWAQKHNLTLLTPESNKTKPWIFADETTVINEVLKCEPDILIAADYTQKIPAQLISKTKFGGLNVHPSLLPAYRGPAPVPWAILNGEAETGVSIVTLTEKFDQGRVITQEKEVIQPTDTTPILLKRLFQKGAQLLLEVLPKYYENSNLQLTNYNLRPTYFGRLTRDTGFERWETIKQAMESGKEANMIERKYRALHPWPGLWTKVMINGKEKRMKLLKIRLQPTTNNLQLVEVQFEGQKPQVYVEVRNNR